jgi:hypothetical protein
MGANRGCLPVTEEKKRPKSYDWYTISGETIRGWGFALVVVVLVAAGYLGYRFVEGLVLEREVAAVIQEAQDLLQTVRSAGGVDSYREEYDQASGHLEEAKASRAVGELKEAYRNGQRSRTLLTSILSALRLRGPEGEAMFIAVEGEVEFRRGERGPWEKARSRVALNAGDYVKTSGSGSAEVMTVDGTLYTVRPDTVILVGRARPAPGVARQQSINLEFGWVDLGTGQSGSRVSTPGAEARIREETSALISYNQEEDVGHFATYEGSMVVATADGTSREVQALEQVVQSGGTLSKPETLPMAPALVAPDDDFEVFLGTDSDLVLTWAPVTGAERYALQVAPSRFFVRSVIDVEDRTETVAKVGLQGEGTFVWRVAAVDANGIQSPWSELRRFRVTAAAGSASSSSGAAAAK